jgi:hypothetical protein
MMMNPYSAAGDRGEFIIMGGTLCLTKRRKKKGERKREKKNEMK